MLGWASPIGKWCGWEVEKKAHLVGTLCAAAGEAADADAVGRAGWLRVLGRRGQDCTVSATLDRSLGPPCLFASHGSRVWWEHFAS